RIAHQHEVAFLKAPHEYLYRPDLVVLDAVQALIQFRDQHAGVPDVDGAHVPGESREARVFRESAQRLTELPGARGNDVKVYAWTECALPRAVQFRHAGYGFERAQERIGDFLVLMQYVGHLDRV